MKTPDVSNKFDGTDENDLLIILMYGDVGAANEWWIKCDICKVVYTLLGLG